MFEVDIRKAIGPRKIAVSFTAESGVTALVGPSGAGKTSILNMIAGIVRPDAGRIVLDGHTLFDAERAIDLPPERRRLGYVFQDDRLFPHRSVRRNLLYGARDKARAGMAADYADIVGLLGLEGLQDRRPRSLSGGEAKRVAIGRALLSRPDALLLDEPLSSIDAARRSAILAAVEQIRDHYGLPVLFVSHRAEEVERIATQVVEMPPAY